MVLEMLYLPNLATKLLRFDVSSNTQFRSGSIPIVYQHKWWLCRIWKCLRAFTLSWYCIFWPVHSWNLQLMGHVWRICISFPKPFTQTSCSASHSCLQRTGAAWTAASMGITITSQNLLMARWCILLIHLKSWNTQSSQSVCEIQVSANVYLHELCWGWCCLLSSYHCTNNWHYWNPLTKEHISPPQKVAVLY